MKSPWSRERERWEELRIEFYLGSAFDVYNEALIGLDAMFATEVSPFENILKIVSRRLNSRFAFHLFSLGN